MEHNDGWDECSTFGKNKIASFGAFTWEQVISFGQSVCHLRLARAKVLFTLRSQKRRSASWQS